jgi:ankyrin repeat protein
MHIAAGMGQLEIVQLIFSIAPLMDRNAATKDGEWTPAAAIGHLEMVPNDKNPENRDGNGLTTLHNASQNQETVQVQVWKLPANKKGFTPLHTAAQHGHLETVKLIIQQTKEKNPAAKDGWTPLHLAAENGHLETVQLILQHAEDKNPADKDGRTPLYFAAQNGHLETVQFILHHVKDKNGSNPLFEFPVQIDKLQKSNPKLGDSLRQHYGQDNIELAILANTFLEKVTITFVHVARARGLAFVIVPGGLGVAG